MVTYECMEVIANHKPIMPRGIRTAAAAVAMAIPLFALKKTIQNPVRCSAFIDKNYWQCDLFLLSLFWFIDVAKRDMLVHYQVGSVDD